MFSAEGEARLQHLVSIYPQKRSALIPMLLLAQKEQGYVTVEAMEYIAGILIFSLRSRVNNVVLLRSCGGNRPVIPHADCTNLLHAPGSDDIEASANKLGVEPWHTADGLLRHRTDNNGSCTTAPAMQVNGEFTRTPCPKSRSVIDELRNRMIEYVTNRDF
jgi:NADH-quinone oxidoreductase subunit E